MQSHDKGVDAVNVHDDHPDPVAVQTKLSIGEKGHLDEILGKWQAYESELLDQGPLEMLVGLRWARQAAVDVGPDGLDGDRRPVFVE